MATNATATFRVRTDGANANGGGFDPGISGAGTDYTDQAAAQASWSNLTLASGTLTDASSGGLFTSAMVGNLVTVASQGYWWITAFTSSNAVTVVAATNTSATSFTGASGKVGGAKLTINPFATQANGSAVTPTTPVSGPGNQLFIRGSGSSNPVSDDYAGVAYFSFPSGDNATGPFKIVGYNGRPRLSTTQTLIVNGGSYLHFETIFFYVISAGSFAGNGILNLSTLSTVRDCIFDSHGNDVNGVNAHSVDACEFRNSGSTAASTISAWAIQEGGYGEVRDTVIHGWRGSGVNLTGYGMTVVNSIISGCGLDGIHQTNGFANANAIINNTIDSNLGHGIYIPDFTRAEFTIIRNNLITNHVTSGKYGLYGNGLTAAQTLAGQVFRADFNDYYGNTVGNYSGFTAGANDRALGTNPYASSPPLTLLNWTRSDTFPSFTFLGSTTVAYPVRGAVASVAGTIVGSYTSYKSGQARRGR